MGSWEISSAAGVVLDLAAKTEEAAIRELMDRTEADHPGVNAELWLKAVMERQKMLPPLLGRHVALPHARTAAVPELTLSVGRCRHEVAFGPEALPVRLIFLFGVPPDCISQYLGVVAQLTRLLKIPGRIDDLLLADNEASFRDGLKPA
jgi:nitrogen PTS system EIIA component